MVNTSHQENTIEEGRNAGITDDEAWVFAWDTAALWKGVPGEALVALGAHSAKERWIELETTSAKTTRRFKVAMKVLCTKTS